MTKWIKTNSQMHCVIVPDGQNIISKSRYMWVHRNGQKARTKIIVNKWYRLQPSGIALDYVYQQTAKQSHSPNHFYSMKIKFLLEFEFSWFVSIVNHISNKYERFQNGKNSRSNKNECNIAEMRFIFTLHCSVHMRNYYLFCVTWKTYSFTGDAKMREQTPTTKMKKGAQFFPLMRIKCHFLY